MPIRVGTAAWAIPRASAASFPEVGSTLERYASVFDAVEINSTFYRSHRPTTFERWAASVPPTFRFSVKVPKTITHEARLSACDAQIIAFVDEVGRLGSKLGPLLLQLPPSLAFDPNLVASAHALLTDGGRLTVVCEPRHATWFTPEVDRWLAERRIARVAADPPQHLKAVQPGGWRGVGYYRLHGSPRVYYSPYDVETLALVAEDLRCSPADETWCIFDNTALGAATPDAMSVKDALAVSDGLMPTGDPREFRMG